MKLPKPRFRGTMTLVQLTGSMETADTEGSFEQGTYARCTGNDCVEMIRRVYSTLDLTWVAFLCLWFLSAWLDARRAVLPILSRARVAPAQSSRTESSERQFDSTVCGWIDWRRVRSDAPDRRDRDHQRWHRGYEWQCQCGERQQHSAYWLLYDHRATTPALQDLPRSTGRHRWKPRPGLRHECQPHADDRAGRVRQPILVDIRCSERVDNHRTVAALSNFLRRPRTWGRPPATLRSCKQHSQSSTNMSIQPTELFRSRAARGVLRSSLTLQTLGDIVAACVNSAGACRRRQCLRPTFHPGNNLRQSSPNRYSGAIVNILHQPTVNVAPIFALLPGNGPFEPTILTLPRIGISPLRRRGFPFPHRLAR